MENEVLQYLFPKQINDRLLRSVTIVGLQGSGKTNLAYYLAGLYLEKYGPGKVNVIYSKSFRNAILKMNKKPVQVFIIDDAVRYQYSGMSRSRDRDIIADYFELRHLYKGDKGLLVTIFITQRFKNLDPVFRNSPVLIFKTILQDPADNELIRNFIGQVYFEELAKITKNIYTQQKDFDKAIVKLAWGPVFLLPNIPRVSAIPNIIYVEETGDKENGKNGRIVVEIYEKYKDVILLRLAGRSLREIHRETGIPLATIHKVIKRVSEQIEKY